MKDAQWPAEDIELIAPDQLTPYARNARMHTDEQIAQVAASIREFGFTMPILRDEHGTVLAGHGRLAAAQRLGLEQVPVITAKGWSEAKKRAYTIADNQLALNADWNYELLASELEDLKTDEFDLTLTGFDEAEIDNLLSSDQPDEDGAPDDFPEADDDIGTDYKCPSCGYEWSGKPK